MGHCASSESVDTKKSVQIDKANQDDARKQGAKLVLLGPGEAGKSTFMKQIISIYGKGHNPRDFTNIIHKNVLANMQLLLSKFDEELLILEIDSSLTECKNAIMELQLHSSGSVMLTEERADFVRQLWCDDAVQTLVREHRSKLQLLDSAPHFLDKVMEIASPDYEPSLQDIVLSRVRTTGVNECSFVLEGQKFSVVDVGGQRSERKKWIHLFEGCTGVIFFAAISEYDQVLYEDEDVNRMEEALNLFREICNSRWFAHCPVILFLNKNDLFKGKVQHVSIQEYYEDFPYSMEEQTYENGLDFFKKKFESKNNDLRRKVYTHNTCVIDDSVKQLFDDVSDIIVKSLATQML